MLTGTVVKWVDSGGYGFVRADGARPADRDVFVPLAVARAAGLDRLAVGDQISFEIEGDRSGRPRATRVELAS